MHSVQFKILRIPCATLVVALFITGAPAADSVKISGVWARATAPGQTTAVVYMEVKSAATAALVAAGTPLAGRAEFHSMTMEGGVMRMRALPRVDLPAGKTVKLAPGGAHLMLIDLKSPLRPGDKVPLVLSVQSPGNSLITLKINAEVRPITDSQHNH